MAIGVKYNLKKVLLDRNVCPFDEWFETLQVDEQYMVDSRLARVRLGAFGEINDVGEGVWELKFRKRRAVRIYYARAGRSILLLIVGGDKRSQGKDIEKAKDLFSAFKRGELSDVEY